MRAEKEEIVKQLRREILSLQGFRAIPGMAIDVDLGPVNGAFPDAIFPTGAIHEFICNSREESAASTGFLSGILSSLMHKGGITVWISQQRKIFPPALKNFGIDPASVIFIDLQKEQDRMWAMEEALKTDCIAAVVGELQELNFTASRRFQLAVEKSDVTGFILRLNPRNNNSNACLARWKITPISGEQYDDMPGVGFPRWNVGLIKIRNGKPGSWQFEWIAGRFHYIPAITEERKVYQIKTG